MMTNAVASAMRFRPRLVDEGATGRTRRLRATICGSFQRHLDEVQGAIQSLARLNVDILSPPSAKADSRRRGFTRLEGDPSRNPKLTEDRHLDAIGESDFVWLVCPDGRPGISGLFELGYAKACGVAVFCDKEIQDLTIREYVTVVGKVDGAVSLAKRDLSRSTTVLLTPTEALAEIRSELATIEALLHWEEEPMHGPASRAVEDAAKRVRGILGNLSRGD